MNRSTKVLLSGLGFGVVVATVIGLATGSPQLGLHGAFWIALVFTLWIESRMAG
jgi:FtsH-binding integral membrane protein